jgi:integrase
MEAGTQYEVSTRTADKKLAQRRLVELREKILAAAPPAGKRITFAQAAELYSAFRRPKPPEQKRLDKVVGELGQQRVDEITHADLVAAANRLFPGQAPSSLNRNCLDVAAAVLHYAAANGYCEWLRVKKFKASRPQARAAQPDAVERLLVVTTGRRHLLLLWLHHQGMRISQTIGVQWEQLDLDEGVVQFFDAKGPRWRTIPLQAEVLDQLREVQEEKRTGRVFPWSTRQNVYRWLRPLVRELGVTFTPHMARHALGKALNADGAPLRTIMAALGHDDARSSIRYQDVEVEVVRAAAAKTPRLKLSGKRVISR